MLEESLPTLAVATALALVVCVAFYAALRRRMAALQSSVGELGSPDHKIRYDVDAALKNIEILRATPGRLDDYKARLEKTCDDLNALRADLPHANEVSLVQQNMQRLCSDFDEYRASVEDKIQKFTKSASDDFSAVRGQMLDDAKASIEKIAREQLLANAVPRDEFESLKAQIEKSLGADEVEERMKVLGVLFDSAQIKTLNWQCRLISLLRGGLAPDAEQDAMISNGIPQSSFVKFLQRLEKSGIIEKKSIPAYYMVPDAEWIYGYVENPDWLQRRLSATVKRERNYQDFVKDNLHLLEDGLQLVSTEYELATGRIDIMCTDSHGRSVGVELKYPAASTHDFRQISGYRNDYVAKTDKTGSRFFIVAPIIPEELRKLAESNEIEWREIPF